jgi:hypothetical protein
MSLGQIWGFHIWSSQLWYLVLLLVNTKVSKERAACPTPPNQHVIPRYIPKVSGFGFWWYKRQEYDSLTNLSSGSYNYDICATLLETGTLPEVTNSFLPYLPDKYFIKFVAYMSYAMPQLPALWPHLNLLQTAPKVSVVLAIATKDASFPKCCNCDGQYSCCCRSFSCS